MGLHQHEADPQPESHPLYGVPAVAIQSLETAEQFCLVFGRYPYPVVPHPNLQLTVQMAGEDSDVTAFRGILDGVFHQVAEHELHTGGIYHGRR